MSIFAKVKSGGLQQSADKLRQVRIGVKGCGAFVLSQQGEFLPALPKLD
jgi:hypothetical protein